MDISHDKSDVKSEKLRAEGNQFYSENNFFEAILKYNESLCYAEAGNKNLGFTYADRSAVYFEMKLYNKCIENIKLAKKNNYPENNYDILFKREEKCMEMLNQDLQKQDIWKFFKLSHPANKKLPFIAECLKLKNDEKYGNYIITSKALETGDILAIENPTSKVIKSDSRYSTCHETNKFQRCANCLLDNFMDLIPCAGCCSTMFCSIDCMDSAQKRHHKLECPIINDLMASGIHQIVLRMFFEGLSLFDGSIEKLESFVNQYGDSLTIFDLNSQELSDDQKNFLATFGLASSTNENYSTDECEEIFMKEENLANMWKTHQGFINKLLQRFLHIGFHYAHGVGAWSLKTNCNESMNPGRQQQLVGNGCYLLLSLLNHSCAPNVRRINVEDKVVLMVFRPIEKNEQLFDCYRHNFNVVSKEKRQQTLINDYGFLCDCEACSDDWPLNRNLESITDELLDYAWNEHKKLPKMHKDEAIEKFQEYCEIINEHFHYYPSAELIIIQECISQCLITITKPSMSIFQPQV